MPSDSVNSPSLDVVVVGAGISGIHLLQRLRSLGFRVLVVEAGDDVGGTWYWNRYPGARCDVESLVYSYSWSDELQQDWQWTERYAPQPEILAYLEHVTDRFDLRRDMRFATRVTAAGWDEATATWTVTTDAGDELTSRFLIMATGCLSVPRLPDVDGLERFAGDVYQTALWPHEPVDFSGLAVGVVGTGSSGVQVVPEIARSAAHLTVFQRTPAFSVPNWNGPLDPAVERDVKEHYAKRRAMARETAGGNPWHERPQSVFAATPEERQTEFEARYRVGGFFLHSAYNDLFTDEAANEIISDFVRDKIRERVDDPELAEQLCPYDYPLATKRMCIDTGYYEAFNRPNVRLVNLRRTPLATVTERGIQIGGSAPEHIDLDALVLATGFDAMTGALAAVDLRGRDHAVAARQVGGWAADVPRPGARRLPQPVHDHRPEQPVGAEQRDGLDRAACRARRDAAPSPARPRPDVDRADGRGRGRLGRAPSGARRGVALPARRFLVHGCERAGQAARAAALRRRRRPVPADLRARRRERPRGLRAPRAAGPRACGGPGRRVRLAAAGTHVRVRSPAWTGIVSVFAGGASGHTQLGW